MATSTSDAINTKKVKGRRVLRYESFDDLMADAEQLAAQPVTTLGNWTFEEILDHLGKSLHMMIDGSNFMMPAPLRLMMRVLMKKKMLNQTLTPGFKIPGAAKQVVPQQTDAAGALERLREAVERVKTETTRSPHPVFGKMADGEWDLFQLRHCEMHMSFVVPAASGGS